MKGISSIVRTRILADGNRLQRPHGLQEELKRQTAQMADAAKRRASHATLAGRVNYWPLLLPHARRHSCFVYVIEEHQPTNGISYDIARKDLLIASNGLKLLCRARKGKRYLFVVPDDFPRLTGPLICFVTSKPASTPILKGHSYRFPPA